MPEWIRHWPPVGPGSLTTVASTKRTGCPFSAGSKLTPLSFHNCWQSCRSQSSDCRNRFNNVTSETSAIPASLACTEVSRNDHPHPTCNSSVRNKSLKDSNPRNRVTAPVLRPNSSQPVGSRPTSTCQSSRMADMHRAYRVSPFEVNPYLSAYGRTPWSARVPLDPLSGARSHFQPADQGVRPLSVFNGVGAFFSLSTGLLQPHRPDH